MHITGYRQPKEEWFDVIRSRQFCYHRIDVDKAALVIKTAGLAATVDGRGIFDATINGMRAPWRLRFAMSFQKHGDQWKIASARYSSF